MLEAMSLNSQGNLFRRGMAACCYGSRMAQPRAADCLSLGPFTGHAQGILLYMPIVKHLGSWCSFLQPGMMLPRSPQHA